MIIVLGSQKGGVGKTTIAVHIALQAYKMGHRVLFIDIDTQADLASWLALKE